MKTVTVTALQEDVTHYLALAEQEDILILNNGKPVGFLRGFADEDDLSEYELESDPRFLERVKRARMQFRAGQGLRLEEVRTDLLGTADEA